MAVGSYEERDPIKHQREPERGSPRMIMRNEMTQNSPAIFDDNRQGGATLPTEGNWASPFIHEFFLVQGSSFRCMAYRNEDGKWRGAFDHEELPGAIRVLE